MRNGEEVFRLYLFGVLEHSPRNIVVFAEYKSSRAVTRLAVNKTFLRKINKLSKKIRDLHEFVETNSPPLGERDLVAIGTELFNLIFQNDVLRLFDEARGRSSPLPLQICTEELEFASWPWEYLYDPGKREYIGRRLHPLSRGVFAWFPGFTPPKPNGPIRILLVLGTSPGAGVDPTEEEQRITEVFQTYCKGVNIDVYRSGGPLELDQRIQNNAYDIVHFYGHGGFDPLKQQGYLKLEYGSKHTKFTAVEFAELCQGRGISLVFLNACESGLTSKTVNPSNSSIAAALIARGVPAVVASQFSIPDSTAHYLAAMIYNGIATGATLADAVSNGRRAMNYAEQKKFVDWGIPVLYSCDPALSLFQIEKGHQPPIWESSFSKAVSGKQNSVRALAASTSIDTPSVTVPRTAIPAQKKRAKMRVSLVDFDAKVAFLPDIVERANSAQDYYNFQVDYLPLPSGVIRQEVGGKRTQYPQLFVPALEDYLTETPKDLRVQKLCCLTSCRIGGIDEGAPYYDYRSSSLATTADVFAISTWNLRKYAVDADISFAKAVLFVCLSMVVATDKRWRDKELIHSETVGCMFDDCENPGDIVRGLRHMKFDHERCRKLISDPSALKAIDEILKLELKSGMGDHAS